MFGLVHITQQYLQQHCDLSEDISTNDVVPHLPLFTLPISYLDNVSLFPLSKTVSDDLELTISSSKPIYHYLFQPKHRYAYNMIEQWNKQYTTDTRYLADTQQVITNMAIYTSRMPPTNYSVNCDVMDEIWTELKHPDFLTKYGYIEWDMLKGFNQSSTFLEALSITSIISPVVSLIIPFLLLIFPFIILKCQGIPITFDLYYDVLKSIAQHHFIGKALSSITDISPEKMVYLLMTLGLYALQIYQNIVQCHHFYTNMTTMNSYLCEMRDYCDYSIHSMEVFLRINENITTYQPFLYDMKLHLASLRQLHDELACICPFTISISKASDMGYMLKCFYQLHSNVAYETALKYSMGFEGYINNMLGLYDHYKAGTLSFASFDNKVQCEIEGQYYPPLMKDDPVKNNCSLEKNMVISSPNAGGKTTMIKTTTINIVFTQQVACGFYERCALQPYTHIHSYLNIPDTSGRDSLFQAESRRCKEIIDTIQQYNKKAHRHFCIFDELYSGTNPIEATKAAYAFLLYLTQFDHVNFILTTHYISICKKLKKSDRIQNYKMDVRILPDGGLEYTYKMKKGISKIQGAVNILRQMSYPEEIIKTIEQYK
jgi:hypothetical protein